MILGRRLCLAGVVPVPGAAFPYHRIWSHVRHLLLLLRPRQALSAEVSRGNTAAAAAAAAQDALSVSGREPRPDEIQVSTVSLLELGHQPYTQPERTLERNATAVTQPKQIPQFRALVRVRVRAIGSPLRMGVRGRWD